jgi:hypothetical protein
MAGAEKPSRGLCPPFPEPPFPTLHHAAPDRRRPAPDMPDRRGRPGGPPPVGGYGEREESDAVSYLTGKGLLHTGFKPGKTQPASHGPAPHP